MWMIHDFIPINNTAISILPYSKLNQHDGFILTNFENEICIPKVFKFQLDHDDNPSNDSMVL